MTNAWEHDFDQYLIGRICRNFDRGKLKSWRDLAEHSQDGSYSPSPCDLETYALWKAGTSKAPEIAGDIIVLC